MYAESLINLAARIARPASWQTAMKKWPGQIAPTVQRAGYRRRPQPGYIGADYERTRIVFLGQNPGSGKGPNNSRPWDIELFQVHLPRFRRDPNQETFSQLNLHLAEKLPEWPFFKRIVPGFPESLGLRIEEITYSNVLPVDSTDELSAKRKAPNSAVFRHSVETFIGPWLDLLKPKLVVVIGKGAAGFLGQNWAARPPGGANHCYHTPQFTMEEQEARGVPK